jgi:hypothetical protein
VTNLALTGWGCYISTGNFTEQNGFPRPPIFFSTGNFTAQNGFLTHPFSISISSLARSSALRNGFRRGVGLRRNGIRGGAGRHRSSPEWVSWRHGSSPEWVVMERCSSPGEEECSLQHVLIHLLWSALRCVRRYERRMVVITTMIGVIRRSDFR